MSNTVETRAGSSSFLQQQKLTPRLLCTNKAVHREASSLFYGKNRFDLSDATPEKVVSFLKQISNNAAYIRHIVIDFPEFLHLDPGHITLVEGSVEILATIRSGCTNLSSLKTPLCSTHAMELKLDSLNNHKVATEALKLVDTHFRAILSLQEIILEADEVSPSGYIREKMKSYGWTISTIEYVEADWDNSFSDFDFDDDGYGGGSGDDDNDDYDIDNDSDFWRRAAD
ncbi:hypothetical protein F4801DRAFT_580423 [Xylaria longipes]|nr:hypothetical protein F4801DRAFT_580423 [Xylaria longipes]RYC65354.1 hypothetical protein CHU98_g850 [Xylaria longipes]